MEFKGSFEKKGHKFDFEVTFNGEIWYYFENETLAHSDKVEEKIRFQYEKGQNKFNKHLGITEKKKQINGINLEKEHLETIRKTVANAKEYVVAEAKKISDEYKKDIKLETGHHNFWRFDIDTKGLHFSIIEKAERMLREKYKLDLIQDKTIRECADDMNCINTDIGDYIISNTYLITEKDIDNMLDVQKKLKETEKRIEKENDEKKEENKIKNGFYEYKKEILEVKKSSGDVIAKVKVTENKTSRAKIYYCSNIFDFGYTITNEEGGMSSNGTEFDKKAFRFLTAYPPISPEIRM